MCWTSEEDVRSASNRHHTGSSCDNLRMREYQGKRKPCHDYRGSNEATKVNGTRSIILRGEIVPAATGEKCVWERRKDESQGCIYVRSSDAPSRVSSDSHMQRTNKQRKPIRPERTRQYDKQEANGQHEGEEDDRWKPCLSTCLQVGP